MSAPAETAITAAAELAEKLSVLKGHDFSRAAAAAGTSSASAAEDTSGGISPKKAYRSGACARSLRGMRLLLAGLCCVLAQAPLARPADASSKQPDAKQLAQRVDSHYNSLHSLKAGFTENYQGLGTDRTESGTLLLLKPGRMRWDYSSPPGKLFLLDGKYAWSYTRGDAQASRIPAKDLDDLRSPLRYLLGHAELAKELNGLQAAPAANGRFTLSGVPKGLESRVERLTLTVTADGVIDGITIQETDDAVTQFTFTNQQPNAPVPASIFHFTPPPGVQVQDSMAPI